MVFDQRWLRCSLGPGIRLGATSVCGPPGNSLPGASTCPCRLQRPTRTCLPYFSETFQALEAASADCLPPRDSAACTPHRTPEPRADALEMAWPLQFIVSPIPHFLAREPGVAGFHREALRA